MNEQYSLACDERYVRVKPMVAILQSNYIPWKGYFDIIHDVDLFVFYDDVQYTKHDWRNRNLIKTAQGPKWLTVPVGTRLDRLVCEVEIHDRAWAQSHWRLIQQHYGTAQYFNLYRPFFEDLYLGRSWQSLSALNQYVITYVAREILGITTRFADSREYASTGNRLERLLDLIRKTGAGTYLSGPSAKDYIDPKRFDDLGIALVWKDYTGYPDYPQFYPPFTHQVTILDLLFHIGPEAPYYIWGWRNKSRSPVASPDTVAP
jgi:hypothetical protein